MKRAYSLSFKWIASSPHVEVETRASGRGKLLFGLSAREDTQMAKYDGWTLGETEALLNMMGGVVVARAVLCGERRIIVEEVSKPRTSILVGEVVKTLTIQPYGAANFAEAVRLGGLDNTDSLDDITRLFGEEQVGLDRPVRVDLVEFDREWRKDEAVAWGVANGNKRPICPAHLLGIAIQRPDEQRERPIVELGSVRDGLVLCLHGSSVWRGLDRSTVRGGWDRGCLVGFVSEPA